MIKIVFVDLLHLYYDHHGIYSLASVIKGKDRQLFFVSSRNFSRVLSKIQQIDPDLVCYASFSATISLYTAFDEFAKKNSEFKSIIGGPGPTYDWSALRKSTIDAICLGEGEYALPDFIENGFQTTKNIVCKKDALPKTFYPLVDMDTLPFPDRTFVYNTDALLRDNPSKQFFSGRGCPYNCSYCFNHKFRELFHGCGPLVRKKSVDYLIEEIKDVRKYYPLKTLIFNDDLFILKKDWFLEFCDRYPGEVGLPYTCNVRANLIDDEIASGLSASGCRGVNWAIETGNEQLRNSMLRRDMTDEQIYHAGQCLTRYGIPFRTGNILGLPGETLAQMYETVEMNIKVKPDISLANIFIPFPGLELTQYAMEQGFCHQPDVRDLPKDYFSNTLLNFSEKDKANIYKIFCLFPLFVKWPLLFYSLKIRKGLMRLPRIVLRPIYELIYTYKMSRFSVPGASLAIKLRMALRHLKNL